jgi:hypothetical protein
MGNLQAYIDRDEEIPEGAGVAGWEMDHVVQHLFRAWIGLGFHRDA